MLWKRKSNFHVQQLRQGQMDRGLGRSLVLRICGPQIQLLKIKDIGEVCRNIYNDNLY